MAAVLDSLKSINAYPIPLRTISDTAVCRGLDLTAEATQELMQSAGYNLAKADLLLWLSLAPDISQGGQDYSFTDGQRVQLRNQANALYKEFEGENGKKKTIYGYKGSRL